jgi:hypothetical protein
VKHPLRGLNNYGRCPKCGLRVAHWRLDKHIDDGQCRSRQNLKKSMEEGLYPTSHFRASSNTVVMLAKWAGITLEKRPVRCIDHGSEWRKYSDKNPTLKITERYMLTTIYVAPEWLCQLGRYRPRGHPFPQALLRRLKEAASNPDLQRALLVQLKISGAKL